jgi:selenocysteine lyase/cysteine desulfurase
MATEIRIRESANGTDSNAIRAGKFGPGIREDFLFDKDYLNLNHGIAAPSVQFQVPDLQSNTGSFGTYPRVVRDVMRSFQDQAEARPDKFIRHEYPNLLDESRAALAELLNVDIDTISFVPNATTGINTILRNFEFKPKEKIVYFATIYGACEKTVTYITETTPAEAVKIEYTYPVSDDWLVDEFRKVVIREQDAGNTIKVAIFDTIVSLPGVRMPFGRLTQVCKELGVLSCVDGAHSIGHISLDLDELDCDFFVSNCHKYALISSSYADWSDNLTRWLFVPRGCAVFYVPMRNQHLIRSTLPTSHGFVPKPRQANSILSVESTLTMCRRPGVTINNPLPPSQKTPYITNFEFVGTIDNAPYLCIPTGLKYREDRLGGEAAILQYCHNLARAGGKRVAEILGTEVLENKEETLGNCCMTNVRLPLKVKEVASIAKDEAIGIPVAQFMSKLLVQEYNTFIAFIFYGGAWWVRLSAQVYLELADFEWAAGVLKDVCGRVLDGEFVKPRN